MSLTSRARRIGKQLPAFSHQRIVEDLRRYKLRPSDDHVYVAAHQSVEFTELTCGDCKRVYPAGLDDHGTLSVSARGCPNCYRAMSKNHDPEEARRGAEAQSEAKWASGRTPEDWELGTARQRRIQRESEMWKRMLDEPGWRPDFTTFDDGPLVLEDLAERHSLLAPAHSILVQASDREFGAYHAPIIASDGEIDAKCDAGYRRLTVVEVERMYADPETNAEEFGYSNSDD